MSDALLYCLARCFLRQDLSLNLRSPFELGLLPSELPGCAWLHPLPSNAGAIGMHSHASLLCVLQGIQMQVLLLA